MVLSMVSKIGNHPLQACPPTDGWDFTVVTCLSDGIAVEVEGLEEFSIERIYENDPTTVESDFTAAYLSAVLLLSSLF